MLQTTVILVVFTVIGRYHSTYKLQSDHATNYSNLIILTVLGRMMGPTSASSAPVFGVMEEAREEANDADGEGVLKHTRDCPVKHKTRFIFEISQITVNVQTRVLKYN